MLLKYEGFVYLNPMIAVKRIALLLFWALVIFTSAYFVWTDVFSYFRGYRSSVYGDSLFKNQIFVVMHMTGGTIALITGPTQFWKSFRDKYRSVHRLMGKFYLIGCLLIVGSAIRTVFFSACRPCQLSLFVTTVLLLITTLTAWFAIKQGNVKQHRQFMVRSYVLILAFILVRINGAMSLDFLFGQIEDPLFRRTVNEYFFSFFPPICAEIVLTWWPFIRHLRR